MSLSAEALKLTQPAVSRSMRALELEFGAALLVRSRQGCELTADGAILCPRVEAFLRQLSAALADAAQPTSRDTAGAEATRRLSGAQFEALLAMGKSGNLREAARRLGVADSSLHRAARDLERLLKTTLYRRTPGGLTLSPSGLELARRFALAAHEIAVARDELKEAHGVPSRKAVVVGAPPLAPKRVLAAACEGLLRADANVGVIVKEAVYDELIDALRRGEIDFIFGALRRPPPFDDLDEQLLFAESYVVVCRREHCLSRRPSVKLEDLNRFEWIFPAASMPRRAVLERLIGRLGTSARVSVETSALEMIVAMLVESDRISLLPRNCAEDRQSQIAIVETSIDQPQRWIGLTTRRDWLPTRAQRDLLRALDKTTAPLATTNYHCPL